MQARRRAFLVIALFSVAVPASAAIWTNIGPGGGYINTVTIDPVTPSTLYATSGLRVFKSTDAGLSWIALAHPPGEILIGEVVVDPLNPSTIFIGGGGADVVKSTDGGATLVRHPIGMSSTSAIAIDPINSQNLWAGGSGAVSRSTDGGITWTPVPLPGGATAFVAELAVDPITPSVVYAGGSLGSGNGVYKSVDGGASYNLVLSGPGVQAIAVDPTTPANVFANDIFTPPFLRRSTDAGASWAPSVTGLVGSVGRRGIAVDPSNSLVVYAGGSAGVFKSTTGGTSWSDSSTGLPPSPQAQCLVIDPSAPSTVYAGTTAGLGKTTDAGASWTVLQQGLNADNTLSVVVDPSDANILYAGSQTLGVSKSVDGGSTWASAANGLPPGPVTQVAVHPATPSTLYAVDGGLSKSTDAATTWGPSDFGMFSQALRVAIAPSNPSTVYAATYGGVYKSIDDGASWNPTLGTPYITFNFMAVDPTNDSVAWAANGLDVYRTTDGGDTWTSASVLPPFFGGSITALAVDPAAPSTLYASVQPGIVFAIVRSTDGGASWGIARFNAVAYEFGFAPGSPSSTVFAATGNGLLASRNGSTWFDLTTLEIPYGLFTSIAVAPPSVYVGVPGHSVWRRSIATCSTAAECDDSNACTTDTCNPSHFLADVVGCVHAAVTCTSPGDCQVATCDPSVGCVASPEPDTTPCTDDGTICTTDVCRSGVCTHDPDVASTCKLPTSPRAATLSLKNLDPAKAKLAWHWKKGLSTSLAEFGDPFSAGATDYTLCGFDRSGPGGAYALLFSVEAPAGDTCPTRACWSTKYTRIRYKDRDHTPDGADTLLLIPGPDGAANISMTAKGTNLDIPSAALVSDVRVQLHRDDAPICWEATFSASIQKNTPGVFRAKSD